MTTNHNLPDITAIREALDAKYGDLPTLKPKASPAPPDHPDNDKTFDDDMGILETLSLNIECALAFCGRKLNSAKELVTDHAEKIYLDMTHENNAPQHMQDKITVFEIIGTLIKGGWA